MYQFIAAGTRVEFEGRVGTIKHDSPTNWQTASVEFDDEKGVIIQKAKTSLKVIPNNPFPPIYWAAFRIAPTKNGMWRTGFKEFADEGARDRFVKNTKYQVTQTGER